MIKSILILFFMSFGLLANASDCPLETGEICPCENEQNAVDTARAGLELAITYKYCGTVSGFTDCRLIRRFKDNYGNISDNVFEEWLIKRVGEDNEATFRGFFVRNPNGSFDIHWHDFYESGPPVINYSRDNQANVWVSFDEGLPTFDVPFYDANTGALLGVTAAVYNYDETSLTRRDENGAIVDQKIYSIQEIY